MKKIITFIFILFFYLECSDQKNYSLILKCAFCSNLEFSKFEKLKTHIYELHEKDSCMICQSNISNTICKHAFCNYFCKLCGAFKTTNLEMIKRHCQNCSKKQKQP